MPLLRFLLFGQSVTIACEDGESANLLALVYEAFAAPAARGPSASALAYAVGRSSAGEFVIRRGAESLPHAANTGLLLSHFGQDLTVELQKRRSDLYFLHAAALECGGRAVLLVGGSGSGKSTTTWGLLHHGFGYASDELAPIDLGTGLVHAFPQALGLKADPPAPYYLPAGVLRTAGTRHVPVDLLPVSLAPWLLPLDAIVFLQYRADSDRPGIRPVGAAEAAARLYVQALNPLAHPGGGLDAALQVVRGARCFALETADLGATCALLGRSVVG